MNTLKSLRLPTGDNDLEAYVKERGVPVLAPPSAPPSASPTAPEVLVQPKPAPCAKMAIEVPAYLPAQLRRMALERDCTIRHLILEGLVRIGCEIAPEDRRKDGRRVTQAADQLGDSVAHAN